MIKDVERSNDCKECRGAISPAETDRTCSAIIEVHTHIVFTVRNMSQKVKMLQDEEWK